MPQRVAPQTLQAAQAGDDVVIADGLLHVHLGRCHHLDQTGCDGARLGARGVPSLLRLLQHDRPADDSMDDDGGAVPDGDPRPRPLHQLLTRQRADVPGRAKLPHAARRPRWGARRSVVLRARFHLRVLLRTLLPPGDARQEAVGD